MQLTLNQWIRVQVPGGARTRWDVGELADPPGPDPGDIPGSKPGIPAHASVAHPAERRSRKAEAGGSRPPGGSLVLVAQRQRRCVECAVNVRSNRTEDTMPVALGATAFCMAGLLGPIPRMGSDGRCSAGMGTVTLDHGFAGSIPARSALQHASLAQSVRARPW
jgi:hypothetical protein